MAQRRMSSTRRSELPLPMTGLNSSGHRLSVEPPFPERGPASALQHEFVYETDLESSIETPGTGTPTTPNGHAISTYPPTSFVTTAGRSRRTPLPLLKFFPLCCARVAEGLIFAVIFRVSNPPLPKLKPAYINEMMLGFGVPEESVGVWSATAESSLMVTEALTAPLYAPIADRIGRRPVFIPLVFFWGVFSVAFGFASSPWSVVVLRACLGLLAGVGVLSRTMLGELCDKSNRVEGFAFFTPALTVGVTVAPLIGGFLSNPVPRLLPASFDLLVRYPYLLPSLVAAMVGFASAVSAFKLLPETLPPALRSNSASRHASEKAAVGGGLLALLRFRKFSNLLVTYCLANVVIFSWEAIFPLFAFTGKDLGGLGLSTQQIGIVLAASAGLSIGMTVWLFPWLNRIMSANTLLRLSLIMYPLGALLFPFIWGLSRNLPAGQLSVASCAVLGVQMVMRRCGDFATTLLDAVLLDAIPAPEYLAMANSATFSLSGLGRALGPFITSSFFAISTHSASPFCVQRHLVWIVLALVALPCVYFAERVVSDDTLAALSSDEETAREPLMGDSALDD